MMSVIHDKGGILVRIDGTDRAASIDSQIVLELVAEWIYRDCKMGSPRREASLPQEKLECEWTRL